MLGRACYALGLADHVDREVADRGDVRPHVRIEALSPEEHVGNPDDRSWRRPELVLVGFDFGHVQPVMHQSGRERNRPDRPRAVEACQRRRDGSDDRTPVDRGRGVSEDPLAMVRAARHADRRGVVTDEPCLTPGEQGEGEPEREWQNVHGASFGLRSKRTP